MSTPAAAPGGRGREEEIRLLYRHLLMREPGEEELAHWCGEAERKDLPFAQLFRLFAGSKEHANRRGVAPGFAPGDPRSPVVDPAEVAQRLRVDRRVPPDRLAGLDLSEEVFLATFDRLRPFVGAVRFAAKAGGTTRYHFENGMYPLGDAIALAAFMGLSRPRRIVEIGSGLSTAAMLDAIDRHGLDTRITCIEPYPDRLRAQLRPGDERRVEIFEAKVQETDPGLCEALEAGDILFIDSTHVMKTGSDVCFELFELLPRLAPGVLVHVHDIHYPFEYPETWILERRYSWNEVYALRAFLSYNRRFRVIYMTSWLGLRHRVALETAYGGPVQNVGACVWMTVEP